MNPGRANTIKWSPSISVLRNSHNIGLIFHLLFINFFLYLFEICISHLDDCRWFSPGTPVFSTNKTYRHDIHRN